MSLGLDFRTDSGNPVDGSNYNSLIDKLASIGPLQIPDLDEFLVKSKVDFLHFYKEKTISKLKIDDFDILKTIGSGTFGTVVLAQLKANESMCAIKIIDKVTVILEKHIRYVHNEKRILQSLNFPFVVYLRYFFVDNKSLYFVMPYVPGGDFYDFLSKNKPLTEIHARFYAAQLVLALEYLHYLGLIHRDVKPENIILDALGYLKLADFGQCTRCYGNERVWTVTGTPEYMAPEIIKGNGYDNSVDWWALGVTVFEMCAGYRPFRRGSISKIYRQVLEGKFQIPLTFSKQLSHLINVLLISSPAKRIANYSKGAKEIKSHYWFKTVDWYGILNRTVKPPYYPNISENKII